MMTVRDFSKEQGGLWLFTLLEGRALEACEHLSLEDIANENGDLALEVAGHAFSREGSP